MVDAVTASAASGRINAGGSMLASNFETFLSLLTAQLKNQDPLSPLDSNEFTAQLTQMAGVEQQLLTNDLLTSLLAQNSGASLADASNYMGRSATAAWSSVKVEGGEATWSYELAKDATSATVQVLDASGKVVFTGDVDDRSAGVHDFTWDGRTTAGGQAADGGVYTLKITAKGANGAAIDSQVLVRGRVSGVELYDGEPYLTVGSSILPLSAVIALEESSAAVAVEDDDYLSAPKAAIGRIASALNPLNLF